MIRKLLTPRIFSVILVILILMTTSHFLINRSKDLTLQISNLNRAPKDLSANNVNQQSPDACKSSQHEGRNKTTLYIVTPTYPRSEQLPELTRLCQTLRLVDNVVFILVEDAVAPTQIIINYLEESGLNYVYLRAEMPEKFRKLKLSRQKPRGVANRNAGIEWIRNNAKEGVLFFADDDNTYDVRIFEDIRSTRKVSMFPVGLVAELGVSTPVVKNGKVVGFYDGWVAARKFPVDMAGFAVNVELLQTFPKAKMPFVVGYEEDGFMKSLNITYKDIEPKANNCTEIWVWHTQTKKSVLSAQTPKKFTMTGTNLEKVHSKIWIDPSKTRHSTNKQNQILNINKKTS